MADKSLFIDIPWTSQPQGAVEIDWSNPVTKELLIALSPRANSVSCKVVTSTIGHNDALVSSHMGPWAGTNLMDSKLTLTSESNKTFLCYTYITNTSGGEVLYYHDGPFGVGTWVVSVGGGGFRLTYKNTSNNLVNSPTTLYTPNAINIAVISVNSTNISFYNNGKLLRVDADPAITSGTPFSVGTLGLASRVNDGLYTCLGVIWNRVLSDQEIKAISDNPWQIFKPRRVYLSFAPKSPWSMRESRMRGITDLVTTSVQEPAFTRPYTSIGKVKSTSVHEIRPEYSALSVWDASDPTIDLISRKKVTIYGGTAINSASPSGPSILLQGTSNDKILLSEISPIGSTFIVIVSFTNLAINTSSTLFSGKTNWTEANGFRVSSNSDQNTIEIAGGDASLFPKLSNAYGIGSLDGKVRTLVMHYRGTSADAYLDGAFLGTVAIAPAGIMPSGFAVGNYSGLGTGAPPQRRIYMAAILLKGNPKELSANPWQIFKSNKTPLFYNRTLYKDIPRYTPPSLESESAVASNIINRVSAIKASQPFGPVNINFSSIFAKGLVAAYAPGMGYDALTGNKQNKICLIQGGTAYTDGVSTYTEEAFPAKNLVDNCTMLVITTPLSLPVSNLCAAAAFETADGTRGGRCIGITPSGSWSVSLVTNNGTFSTTETVPVTLGKEVTVCMSRVAGSSSPTRLYVNGISKYVSDIPNTADWGNGSPQYRLRIGYGYGFYGTYYNGMTRLVLVWNRVLTPMEVKAISNNPWQIFKSNNTPIFGGGTQ